MMIRFTIVTVFALIASQLSAQFTEKLDKEIAELRSKLDLDGISRDNYFTALDQMSGNVSSDEVDKIMTGPWWRYSHTVYPDGREVRLSNTKGVLKFPDESGAYYINRNEKDTVWCDWVYEEGRLDLKRYQNKSKEGSALLEPYRIHSLTEKRLVLISLVRSKKFPKKYRAVFHVYFRR